MYQTVDSVPDEAKQIMDQDTLEKSRRYQLDKSTFSLCHDLFSHVEFTVRLVWLINLVLASIVCVCVFFSFLSS